MILHKLPSLTHLTLTWPSSNGRQSVAHENRLSIFHGHDQYFLTALLIEVSCKKNNSLPRPSMREKTSHWQLNKWDAKSSGTRLICNKIISVLFFLLLNNISRTVQIAIFAYHHGRDSESRMLIPSHKYIHKWIRISDRGYYNRLGHTFGPLVRISRDSSRIRMCVCIRKSLSNRFEIRKYVFFLLLPLQTTLVHFSWQIKLNI